MNPLLLAESIALVALLGMSAFFSMTETAFIGVGRHQVKQAAQTSRRARLVDKMLDDPERILSTVLVGNTIANIGAATLGTVIADQLFTRWSDFIAAVVLTLVVLILCELVPKTIAVQDPLRFAKNLAPGLRLVESILRPVIAAAGGIAKSIVRLFGFRPMGKTPYITSEEIQLLVEAGVQHGDVVQFEQRVIKELFDFTETDVQRVMTSADKVHFLPKEATMAQAADLAARTGRTRILVVDGSFQQILGCVHVRDIVKFPDTQLEKMPVTHSLRAVLMAPADTPADRLLVRMQKEHRLLAVIQDAEGKNLGICTVEDLLEELVGEIHDEFDTAKGAAHGHPGQATSGTHAAVAPAMSSPSRTSAPPSASDKQA